MLLGFLQRQRDAVLKIVEGLPEEAWQTPVVPSGWTVAGMLAHLGGAEHHWFQKVIAGGAEEPPPDEEQGEEKAGEYNPNAAFTCDWPSAGIIADCRAECRKSDEVLAVTPLSAAPRRLDFHYLAVAVAQQRQQEADPDLDAGSIPVTVPELLRLLRGTVIPLPR